jgi:hypothetical protein
MDGDESITRELAWMGFRAVLSDESETLLILILLFI